MSFSTQFIDFFYFWITYDLFLKFEVFYVKQGSACFTLETKLNFINKELLLLLRYIHLNDVLLLVLFIFQITFEYVFYYFQENFFIENFYLFIY